MHPSSHSSAPHISLHPAFYLAPTQLQSSFQYPSPMVHFPFSIIILTQGCLFSLDPQLPICVPFFKSFSFSAWTEGHHQHL